MSPVLEHGMKHLGNQTGKISFIYQGLFKFFSKQALLTEVYILPCVTKYDITLQHFS